MDIINVAKAIVSSYRNRPDISHLDSGNLPSRDEVITIVLMLRELLFPGYFGTQHLPSAAVEYTVGQLLINIHSKLHEQICNSMKFQARKNIDVEKKADEIISEFFARIPRIREILATDVQAAFDGDPAATDTDEVIFSYPGVFAISVQRLAHELYLLDVPLIPRIMTEYAHNVTGIDIHAGATIGEYFFIDHGTGVVIGETSVIGNHVTIYQGVTLGALSTRGGQFLRGTKRHPTIEDGVTVYAGASILGGETVIGEGVAIGSNVFITRSVPDRTRVSVKNPELQFKDQRPREFQQDAFLDWVI
ncbi:MAG: Serine acetyltransferase [Syntrophorhabdaceae bacterium PtaU1.Bin034]|nr:MAG: Serine acetyltransferase [Syntrophorhabdaceae bacterium PtaU1.Bin034]